jgi:glycosyltransferase involved in cell wall biosynthesis
MFSNVRSDHLCQRHHYVAEWRATVGRTVWIETLGSRSPRLSDLSRLRGEGAGQSRTALLPRVETSNPGIVPLHGSKSLYRLNTRLLERRLGRLRIAPEETTAWVYLAHPVVLDVLARQPWRTVVYDLCDDIDDMDVHPSLRMSEPGLMKRADFIFATSEPLAEKARRATDPGKVHYVPNAVDPARFSGINRASRPRTPLQTVLYFGAIYEWFDEELVAEVAGARPDIDFRLVGPVRRRLPRLKGLGNVELAGAVAADAIPAELEAADLTIIPFRPGRLMQATDPLKMYETLIAERPVLTTVMPQGKRFEPAVRLEEDRDGWLRAITDLESGRWDYDRRSISDRISSEETWQQRFSAMSEVLGREAART